MNKFITGVLSAIRNHPYATAAGALVTAEVLRSKDCQRSVLSDIVTLGAIGATVNAAVHAGRSASAMLGGRTDEDAVSAAYIKGAADEHDRLRVEGRLTAPLSNPRRVAASGSGRLTGLPVVPRSAFTHGLTASTLASRPGHRPTVVGITSPRALRKGEVVVRGRHGDLHVIDRACGSRVGHPGAALRLGHYAGCDRRHAGQVMGIKSWRDTSANTDAREASSLHNLVRAFRARGETPPASVRHRLAQLKKRGL